MPKKTIDLDALADVRREAEAEAPVVKFRGKEFEMPIEMPFVLVEAAGRLAAVEDDEDKQGAVVGEMLGDVARSLFGAKYKEFIDLGPSTGDVLDLITAVSGAYGTSSGESSASGTS